MWLCSLFCVGWLWWVGVLVLGLGFVVGCGCCVRCCVGVCGVGRFVG